MPNPGKMALILRKTVDKLTQTGEKVIKEPSKMKNSAKIMNF
jgi:hypothetical protein